jgi:hypothetical protein
VVRSDTWISVELDQLIIVIPVHPDTLKDAKLRTCRGNESDETLFLPGITLIFGGVKFQISDASVRYLMVLCASQGAEQLE